MAANRVWVSQQDVIVHTEIVTRLGHFNSLDELNAFAERLWGPIADCEEEGSIPWFKALRCQKEHGYDLVLVTIPWVGGTICNGKDEES